MIMVDIIDATGVSMTTLSNPREFARNLAANRAAITGNPTRVIMPDGSSATAVPPPRPSDILQTATGSPPAQPPPSEGRSQATNEGRAQGERGTSNENDEGDAGKSGGAPTNQQFDVFGPIREAGAAVIPTLEALLFEVPQQAIQKFTELLPATFRALLPIGAIAGLVSKGSIPLSPLLRLASGAALGAVAGQAIRSLSGGIGTVQGLTGALGAQTISRVTGSSAVPVNINTTFGNAILSRTADGSAALTAAQSELRRLSSTISGQVTEFIGAPATQDQAASLTPAQLELRRQTATISRQTSEFLGTPETSAVIANVVGSVGNLAQNRATMGVPVGPGILSLGANVALRNAGVPTADRKSVV